jgi:WD40 repeat protein
MNSPLNIFVVDFKKQFYICDFESTLISDPYKTRQNGKGIICIRNQASDTVVAYPNENIGCVNILTRGQNSSSTLVLPCHRNEIDMLDLSLDCSLVVTASTNGRNIKIFDKSGKLIQTVRRGFTSSVIYRLTIHPQNLFVMAASQAGTIHVFKVVS